MNKILRGATLAAVLSITTVQTGQAQGIGPLLDWIHKLSGPQLWGVGASVYMPLERENPKSPNVSAISIS